MVEITKTINIKTGTNNISKRTRFNPSVLQVSTRNRQQHKSFALAIIKLHTELLQENLAYLFNDIFTKNVTYHHCIWENNSQLKKFNEYQDLIPKWSRIDFKFHVSQEYEQSEELSTLKEETYQIIANLQKSLRNR